jgi:N6-L-threonylcarbamoyladenine synthase
MKILGIETSCDETSAAVVCDGVDVLSNVVVSSLKEHVKYGGIIPEIASRRQIECINPVVSQALSEAKTGLDDIDAIAVTTSPGLIGSLLVGISFARALSSALKKTLIEVDHIKAHLYANFLDSESRKNKTAFVPPSLPAVGLVVSGGHTALYDIPDLRHFKLLGQTRDDAAGEAFDKVARLLDLGYPGGPVIDRLSKGGKSSRVRFPRAQLNNNYDFSFSGLKTAVLYHHRDNSQAKQYSIPEVVFSFQESVVSSLIEKSLAACMAKGVKTLLVGGGVAANSRLREELAQACQKEKIKVHFPPMKLCLDNAAMIAGFAYHLPRTRR